MGCYGNDLDGLTPAPNEWGTRGPAVFVTQSTGRETTLRPVPS
jgi:hypothetical protein